jgi:hypothetical protein
MGRLCHCRLVLFLVATLMSAPQRDVLRRANRHGQKKQ